MPFGKICAAALAILCAAAVVAADPSGAIIVGRVSYSRNSSKA